MSNNRIRIAIIGRGNAAKRHAEAVAECDGLEIVGVCDPLGPHSQPNSSWSLGLPLISLETLWADGNIELVAVCTPPGTHVPLATTALSNGKAVVVEKPAATSTEDLYHLVLERNRSRRPVAVMHQHRFVLPEDVLSARWSEFTFATVEVYRRRPLSYFESSPWRTVPDLAGGGAFAHLGVHYADLACQLLGVPVEVSGYVTCDFHPGIDTRVTLAVRFETGAMMCLNCSSMSSNRHERLTIQDGHLHLEVVDGACRWSRKEGTEECLPTVPKMQLYKEVYREIAEAIRHGEYVLSRSDVETSNGAIKILTAVRQLANSRT